MLRVLFAHGGALSISQLAREGGLTPRGTRQTIQTLMGNKLLKAHGQSRSQLFSIDCHNPLANSLKELFGSEQTRWEGVQAALRNTLMSNDQIDAAWYYGSVARGEDTATSDLDIVVIAKEGQADATIEAVREALQMLEDRLYVTCSVVGLSSTDLIRLSQGDAWWDNLVRDAKILKGSGPEQHLAKIRSSLP